MPKTFLFFVVFFKRNSGAEKRNSGAEKLSSGAERSNSGAQKRNSGAEKLNSGAQKPNSGAEKLSSGAEKLSSGAERSNSGAQKRNSGAEKHKYRECLIEFCKTPRTAKEISRHLGFKSKNYVREKIIKPLLQTDILEFTNKEVRNARNQKYKIKTK